MTKEEFMQRANSNAPTVYILRGLPGSGKSTVAKGIKSLFSNAIICSSDNFWIQNDGSYKFEASLVPHNHYQCLRHFCQAISAGPSITSCVIVDNTSCSLWEFDHFTRIGLAYGYKVFVVTCHVDIATSLKRNTHNVPEEKIKRMMDRLVHCDAPLENFAKIHGVTLFDIDNT